jgi:glyoxylase-like metal-dependent hydrolase (beta-lactamase superfamily II)
VSKGTDGSRSQIDLVTREADATGVLHARLLLGPHRNLVYVVADPATGEAAVIDPAHDIPRILEVARDWGVSIRHALFTHHHPDHTGGASAMHEATGCALHAHAADASESEAQGIVVKRLRGGDRIPLGGKTILAHHTPGHTAGAMSYQLGHRLYTGDFLFIGTCGRTDFPTGSKHEMWASLQHLKTHFDDDTILCPGHHYGEAPEARLGDEKQRNPALLHRRYVDFAKEWFLAAY